MPGSLWLKADDVAREGYDAVMKGHSVVVNGAHLPVSGVADRRRCRAACRAGSRALAGRRYRKTCNGNTRARRGPYHPAMV